MKYRKKPIVIEAFQFKKKVRWQPEEWPEWLQEAGNLRGFNVGALVVVNCDKIGIQTLEGVMTVDWDDFIIQGVQGELYPCKPDIFHATYEAVDMKYRKKPIVIEAFHMTEASARDRTTWPLWLLIASQGLSAYFCCDGPDNIFIGTLEGRLKVSLNDFIIQGVQGELYPCKPDIFHATYEEVI